MTEEKEQIYKKKLQTFLSDLLKTGSVKGFKYFAMYLRGKEELIISVVNEPVSPNNSYGSEPCSPLAASFASGFSNSLTSGNLPYDKRSLMLSARTQQNLSGYGDIGVGLPPASPSDREIVQPDENSTLFLLAGYARYNSPYVWVRTNHQRLVRFLGKDEKDKDNPLRLKSTKTWLEQDIKIWDILSELVRLCTYPPPLNPFAVDFEYFNNLPPYERLIATGAMVNFLQKIIMSASEDKSYTAKVMEDLQELTKIHFIELQMAAQAGNIPILNQSKTDKSSNSRRQSRDTNISYTRHKQAGGNYTYSYKTGVF